MVKQKVKRRGDHIAALNGRVVIAILIMAAVILAVVGPALYQSYNNGKDDEVGAKQTTDTGVNLTASDLGSPWNTQSSNVAIDKPETVTQWMQTQAKPGDTQIVDPKECNDLLGAVPMFTGQADQAMLSVTENDRYSTKSQSPDAASANGGETEQQGTSMIQATIGYSDTVSGSLGVDTIKSGLKNCISDSALSDDAKDALDDEFKDSIDYSFTENKDAAVGDHSAAYQIVASGKDKKGESKPLVNINVGVYYSETYNAGTIIFIRSGSEDYDSGKADMKNALTKAAQKLETNGPQLGKKEVED